MILANRDLIKVEQRAHCTCGVCQRRAVVKVYRARHHRVLPAWKLKQAEGAHTQMLQYPTTSVTSGKYNFEVPWMADSRRETK